MIGNTDLSFFMVEIVTVKPSWVSPFVLFTVVGCRRPVSAAAAKWSHSVNSTSLPQ